jgi:ribosomal protein L21E
VGTGPFRLAPRVGDRLAISIYYDQRGHAFFTATDLTRPATQTVMLYVGRLIYSAAGLWVQTDRVLSVVPPAVGTRLWQFTGSRLTTYRGDHGTVTGPWTTSKMITTTTGTASGTVIVSPSGLSNGGRDFTAWLRALPASYNITLAGYQAHGRSFRFITTTLTVPPRVLSKDQRYDALIGLHTSCGSQCQGPLAVIEVLAGGGPGSVQYQAFLTPGNFLVSPRVGDRLAISIYYDQRGHDYFTATDLTQHTTQTVRLAAGGINPVFDSARLSAVVGGTVPPPAADTRLWQFTGSHLTTYGGARGTVIGPWQTSTLIRTSDGTPAGTVVASPSGLSNGGQDFGVWLRH